MAKNNQGAENPVRLVKGAGGLVGSTGPISSDMVEKKKGSQGGKCKGSGFWEAKG